MSDRGVSLTLRFDSIINFFFIIYLSIQKNEMVDDLVIVRHRRELVDHHHQDDSKLDFFIIELMMFFFDFSSRSPSHHRSRRSPGSPRGGAGPSRPGGDVHRENPVPSPVLGVFGLSQYTTERNLKGFSIGN